MSSTKFDGMWKLMSQYTFKTDSDSINDDLICLLCKGWMIDACQTACGCQYCYKCISDYIGAEDKHCPGSKEECNEEYLVIERDVMKNIRMNNRISKLKLKCPNESCKFTMELLKMEEHLRVCSLEVLQCPYKILGCDNLQNHVNGDVLLHTQLLMDWINNLRNEVDGLKETIKLEKVLPKEEIKNENIQLKKIMKLINKQKRENKMMIQYLNKKENKIKVLEELSSSNENKILTLERELKQLKNVTELRFSAIIDEANQKELQTEIRILEIEKKRNDFGIKIMNKLESQLKDLKNEIDIITEKIENKNEEIKEKTTLQLSSIPQSFQWKIVNILTTRGTIFSHGSYLHNYKICISAFVSEKYMSLWCYIMRGDNDDRLEWPLRRYVTLAIINQKTSEVFKTKTFQYETYDSNYQLAFHRPTGRRNDCAIGFSSFLYFCTIGDSLMDSVIVDGSMIVSCGLGDVPL